MDKEKAQNLLEKLGGIAADLDHIAGEVGIIIDEAILDEKDRNDANNVVLTIQEIEDTIRETLLSAPSLDPDFKKAYTNY